MGLLSFFKREDKPSGAGSSEAGDAVREARTRARRRLIGAVVLLVIGVIGFPLVFETRPRPIPVDIPIEIPRKDVAAPLPMPPARPAAAASTAVQARALAAKPRDEVITETPGDAGREVTARAPAAANDNGRPGEKPAANANRKPESAVASIEAARKPPATTPEAPRKTPATAEAPRKAQDTPADGARARALLEAKPAAAADAGRYVVQVGAFAEADAARETRARVEKLGMKTYTQVAQTPAGSRIRVRVGPFGTRAEADAALARAKAAGLNAVVLTL